MKSKMSEENKGATIFSLIMLLLAILIVGRSFNRGSMVKLMPSEEIKTEHISKVCIEGDWDECFEFPGGGEIVKVYFVKANKDDDNYILFIKPTR